MGLERIPMLTLRSRLRHLRVLPEWRLERTGLTLANGGSPLGPQAMRGPPPRTLRHPERDQGCRVPEEGQKRQVVSRA